MTLFDSLLLAGLVLALLLSPWVVRNRLVAWIDRKRLALFERLDGTGFGVGTGIHFVSGVPGGGKSLWVMCEYIAAELLGGRRIVVTNFKFGAKLVLLRAWMARHGIPDWRLQILPDENARKFYFQRYRVGGRSGICLPYQWQDLSEREWKDGKLPRWRVRTGDPGILYVLEETANLFRAKEWQQFPASATFYLSQHRKSGDGVIVLTQDVDLISLDFRRLAQDFTYLQNYGQSAFRGIYLGQRFEARTYLHAVTRGANKGVPVKVKVFTLNRELANLYETDAGVGFKGAGADKKFRPKGIPLWVPAAALIVLAVGTWYAVTWGSAWAAGKVNAKAKRGASTVQEMVTGRKPSAATNAAVVSPRPSGVATTGVVAPPSVFLTGFVRNTDGTGLFFLSNGVQLRNPEAVFDGRRLALRSGESYTFRN